MPSPPTSPGRSLENLARESVPKLALSTLLWGQVLLVPQGATTCYVTLLFPGSSSQPLPLTLKTLTGFVAPRKALVQVIPRQRRFTAGVRRLCLGAGSRLRCCLKAKSASWLLCCCSRCFLLSDSDLELRRVMSRANASLAAGHFPAGMLSRQPEFCFLVGRSLSPPERLGAPKRSWQFRKTVAQLMTRI